MNSPGGWIYILGNSHMRGILKIGRTDRSPRERVDELSSASGIPTPFILIWDEEVTDSVAAEEEIHRLLAEYRVSLDREFFRLDAKAAIEAVTNVASRFGKAPADEDGRQVGEDWDRQDGLLVAALKIVQEKGSIEPRIIRMHLGASFEESRAVFEKLKLMAAIDSNGRVLKGYWRGEIEKEMRRLTDDESMI